MTKILIVDDEPLILRSTESLLEVFGYQTATVSDPSRVLEVARRERPDVILQDVRMPGLDLESLVANIRADADIGATPIILFSAGMDLQRVQEQVKASAVLEKPFKPQQALAVIQRVAAEA